MDSSATPPRRAVERAVAGCGGGVRDRSACGVAVRPVSPRWRAAVCGVSPAAGGAVGVDLQDRAALRPRVQGRRPRRRSHRALAAVEVLARRDAHTDGGPSLRNRIDAEEAHVEREYRAFLHATRAVTRAAGRRPAGMGIRARLRAITSAAPSPERREAGARGPEQPPLDEFLRDLDEFLQDVERPQPATEQDAARDDRDAGVPPAP
jgi:hypothetical protein